MTPRDRPPLPAPADAVVARVEAPAKTAEANVHIGCDDERDVGRDLSEDLGRDIVDQWGEQSFPASDPPANW